MTDLDVVTAALEVCGVDYDEYERPAGVYVAAPDGAWSVGFTGDHRIARDFATARIVLGRRFVDIGC